MPGRKCSLCGGRLDHNNFCTECGLDNNKSDKNYRINKSSCDGQPLTHVHEERKSYAPPAEEKWTGRASGERKKSRVKVIAVIIVVLMILSAGGVVKELFWNIVYTIETKTGMSDSEDYEDYDPYEYAERELSEEGETAEYVLESGEYVVGVHIPEGRYSAQVQDDFDSIQIDDKQNTIYLYEYAGKSGGNYLDDLRLYDGAQVEISAENHNTVTLRSENAQVSELHGMENPLTETVELKNKKVCVAGKDFEAGVYDVELRKGSAQAELSIYDDDGELYNRYYISLNADGENTYRNLVIPEGAKLSFGETAVEAVLTPSELIASTNYLKYYIFYLEDE